MHIATTMAPCDGSFHCSMSWSSAPALSLDPRAHGEEPIRMQNRPPGMDDAKL
jgi:hypothetical protein